MGSSTAVRIARRAAAVLGAGLAIGAAVAPAASAALPPLKSDGQGVAIVNRHGVAFSFSTTAATRYKAIVGRRVAISCGKVSTQLGGLLTSVTSHAVIRTAPRTGSTVTSGIRNGADYCALGRVKGKKQTVVAVVGETRMGQLFLDQDADVRVILTVFFSPYSFIVKQEPLILAQINGVVLPSENAPVPAGKFGLYEKPDHLYIGVRDAAGVLLFVQHDVATVSTNLLSFISKSLAPTYVGETLPLT
jgi:hypothetical protein